MQFTDEIKALVKQFSDRSRKAKRVGSQVVIPHKFKPTGEVVTNENFDPRTDLSKLNQKDWELLALLKEKAWSLEKACDHLGVSKESVEARWKRVKYFEFEEQRCKALAALLSPEFVAAENMRGYYEDNMSDGRRDHLKELAKISGAYKPTTNINLNVSAFVKPQLSPEEEKKTREFFDTIAVEGTVA